MTETINNLMKAFIGESQARNRYNMYSKIAKKEGYEHIAEIFNLTADNEQEHAKWNFRMINTIKTKLNLDINEVNVNAGGPIVLGTTIENLKSAIAGETYETTTMYPDFADVADKEGLPEIANRLRAIGKAELHHKERYEKLLSELETGTHFKKSDKVKWICRKCGYAHINEQPPEKCPSCGHPKSYFEI